MALYYIVAEMGFAPTPRIVLKFQHFEEERIFYNFLFLLGFQNILK